MVENNSHLSPTVSTSTGIIITDTSGKSQYRKKKRGESNRDISERAGGVASNPGLSPTENASTGIIITDSGRKVNTERNAGKSKRDTAQHIADDGVVTTDRRRNSASTVDSITDKGRKVNTESEKSLKSSRAAGFHCKQCI